MTGSEGNALLVVAGVGKVFKTGRVSRRVLGGVSFELPRGRVLGVVGESGSGKSTLGRIVAGFLDATEGSVTLSAPKAADQGEPVSRGVQMIFQESANALNPRLPVWKSVCEAIVGSAPLTARHRDEAMEYIDYVGLDSSTALKRPAQLSGGQRQRVSIARALAARPAVLVCDEAVSSLDVSVRATVLNLLNRIRRERGVGLVFISHDIAIVSHMADEVIVLSRGEVMDHGPTREVLAHPRSEYTRGLIAAAPQLERMAETARP